MENNCKCSISYPHSHLVHGKTFDCEKGNVDIPVIGMTSFVWSNPLFGYGKLKETGKPKTEGNSSTPFIVIA